MEQVFDIHGVEVKVGDRVRYLDNTTDIKAHDNFIGTVRYELGYGLVTDSPLGGKAVRPLARISKQPKGRFEVVK